MKTKLILISLLIVITINVHAQTGWFSQISNVNFNLTKVVFVNSSTGFITGYSNNILKTTNSGDMWVEIFTADSITQLRDICFINQNTGYAVGGTFYFETGTFYLTCTIIKTTNSGNDWFAVMRDTNGTFGHDLICNSVFFVNENTGYSGAGAFLLGSNKLFKTTDGGNSWSNSSFSNINGLPSSIKFTDNLNGISSLSSSLVKTTDGGNNWINVFAGDFIFDVFLLNGNSFYACGGTYFSSINGKSLIIKSENGGDNWQTLFDRIGSNYHDLNSIYFPDANTGYAVGATEYGTGTDTNSIILKTTDQGINWGFQSRPLNSLHSVYFTNINTGYAVGSNGTILKTTDGGGAITSNILTFSNIIPEKITLSQNYPNPFNPSTIINYSITQDTRRETQDVKLIIYNNLGMEIKTLVNEKHNAGSYAVEFNGEGLPSGVYFYKLEAGEFVETKRMVLLK